MTILCAFSYNDSFGQKPSKEERKARKDSLRQDKIDSGKIMITPVAGPAYTPELGAILAASAMVSFKTNRHDTCIQRSTIPTEAGVSTTGAYFFSSVLTSYRMQDKIRINNDLWFKNMPDNYWGVGYQAGRNTEKSDSTTSYNRTWAWLNPKVFWQFKKNHFGGFNLDLNYTKARDVSPGMERDDYYREFGSSNFNSGAGLIYRYDSRDVPINAWTGFYLNVSATFYGEFPGSENQYQVYLIDSRKYFNLFNRKGSTLASQLKLRIAIGEVPYGELSQMGTPFDLRGYPWGQYRDKTMLFLISEYRYVFMKNEGTLSKSGLVGWVGAGSIGATVESFQGVLSNVGFGYRYEVQPRVNLRIDFGWGLEAFGFYFNFNEAF